MARANFTQKVKKLIESAAGHQCSFPACNRRTIGPGPSSEYLSNSGYAAHIFAASSGGPRGQGGLSKSELKSAANGIWLCGRHAKLVDNNRGQSYPAETLLSYKALHEARVALEHEGLYPPIGWLHRLTIDSSPLFNDPQDLQLAKLNLIYGNNGTGKTALVEWIEGFFSIDALNRWIPADNYRLSVRLSLLNPKLQQLGLSLGDSSLKYSIGDSRVAYIPIGYNIIHPAQLDWRLDDDREMLSVAFNLPEAAIDGLLDEVNTFRYATVTNLKFEVQGDDERIDVERYVLVADVVGTHPGLPLRCLAGREIERVVVELATAAARLSGKYCPTLLILDNTVSIFFDGFFEFYSRHFLDPLNQFQTLLCIPERDLDLENVKWNGWQVIRTLGRPPNVTLSH